MTYIVKCGSCDGAIDNNTLRQLHEVHDMYFEGKIPDNVFLGQLYKIFIQAPFKDIALIFDAEEALSIGSYLVRGLSQEDHEDAGINVLVSLINNKIFNREFHCQECESAWKEKAWKRLLSCHTSNEGSGGKQSETEVQMGASDLVSDEVDLISKATMEKIAEEKNLNKDTDNDDDDDDENDVESDSEIDCENGDCDVCGNENGDGLMSVC